MSEPGFLCIGRNGDAICPRRMNCDRYLTALVTTDSTRDGRPIAAWLCTDTRDAFERVQPSATFHPATRNAT